MTRRYQNPWKSKFKSISKFIPSEYSKDSCYKLYPFEDSSIDWLNNRKKLLVSKGKDLKSKNDFGKWSDYNLKKSTLQDEIEITGENLDKIRKNLKNLPPRPLLQIFSKDPQRENLLSQESQWLKVRLSYFSQLDKLTKMNKLLDENYQEYLFVEDFLSFIERRIETILKSELKEQQKLLNQDLRTKLEKEKKEKILLKQKQIEDERKRKEQDMKSFVKDKVKDKRILLDIKKKTLKKNPICPYCQIKLTSSVNSHVDHIYPLSKGGLETDENLVYVCSSCNLKKSNLTLNQFIKKYELNRDLIENYLEKYDKSF